MKRQILISEFKARCIAIIKNVKARGEPITVTLRGVPLADVVPVAEESGGKRELGSLAGSMKIKGDIVGTDSTADWESLRK